MDPSRPELDLIFEAAVSRPPEERAAWLEAACGEDRALKAAVQALLTAHERAGGILSVAPGQIATDLRAEAPAVDADAPEALTAAIGDRYELKDVIGRGGMGTVYMARDRKHGRDVAIKTIHPDLTTGLGSVRFEREIQLTAGLQHPYIVQLLDSGVAGGFLYYIMPCLGGESLRERLDRDGAIEAMEAIAIACDIAEGLEYAHDRGVIHRDIKPSNIMLDGSHALICDFGIAKAVADAGEDLTQTGFAIGTPAYMAPEQFHGQVSEQSDVYAVGAVVFEAISGRQWPIGGTTVPDWNVLDADLIPIIARALAREPAHRWESAASMRTALKSWLRERESGHTPAPIRQSAGIMSRLRRSLRGTRSTRHVSTKSIAVLPLANMSGDSDTEYFSDGITDDIIAQLSRIRELKVISRTSIMRYKRSDRPIREIGRELGVAHVLEGSVRRSGDRIRIVSQLIEVATQETRWTETYDRDLTDVFAIQSEVAQRIASALKATISDTERSMIERRPTDNVEAHRLYLRGRHLWNRRTKAGLEQAVVSFSQAVELDPGFALAHAGLADALLLLGSYGYVPELQAVAEARTAARRALEIDERLAEAHASLGQVYRTERNWEQEEREYLRAIELNPNYATAHQWYSTLLAALGRLDEASAQIAIARELDPLSLAIGVTAGSILCMKRDYEASIQQFDRTLELDPNFFAPYAWKVLSYGASGQHAAAARAVEKVLALRPDLKHVDLFLAEQLAMAGRTDKAMEIVTRIEEDGGDQVWLGLIYAQLGDADRAFELLISALDDDSWCMFVLTRNLLFYMKAGPWFDQIRSDPRFDELLRRMNFDD